MACGGRGWGISMAVGETGVGAASPGSRGAGSRTATAVRSKRVMAVLFLGPRASRPLQCDSYFCAKVHRATPPDYQRARRPRSQEKSLRWRDHIQYRFNVTAL